MIWCKALVSFCLSMQILSDVSALECYVCTKIIQSGEDCGAVRADMLQKCDSAQNQDICVTTSVTLVGTGEATPTISRQCGKSMDYASLAQSGQSTINGFSTAHQETSTSYSEGARLSKLCQCNWSGCNGKSMRELVYGSGTGSLHWQYRSVVLVFLLVFLLLSILAQ